MNGTEKNNESRPETLLCRHTTRVRSGRASRRARLTDENARDVHTCTRKYHDPRDFGGRTVVRRRFISRLSARRFGRRSCVPSSKTPEKSTCPPRPLLACVFTSDVSLSGSNGSARETAASGRETREKKTLGDFAAPLSDTCAARAAKNAERKPYGRTP